nr:MAG TPA: hypothetical protein [Caudoviricetes sp.]
MKKFRLLLEALRLRTYSTPLGTILPLDNFLVSFDAAAAFV